MSPNGQSLARGGDTGANKVFAYLIDRSEEYGYIIYWGTVGFSIRYRGPQDQYASTFMYGYPPNYYQFYLGQPGFDIDRKKHIRVDLLATGLFKEKGKLTLETEITSGTADKVIQVIDHGFELVRIELDKTK